MRIVEEDDLRRIVGEPEALAAVEIAFRAVAEGRVTQPLPFWMELEKVRGEIHVKGAFLEGEAVFAI